TGGQRRRLERWLAAVEAEITNAVEAGRRQQREVGRQVLVGEEALDGALVQTDHERARGPGRVAVRHEHRAGGSPPAEPVKARGNAERLARPSRVNVPGDHGPGGPHGV